MEESQKEKTIKCENCKQEILESKLILHQAFCLRNNKYCNKCKKAVLLSEYEEHIKSHEQKKEEPKKQILENKKENITNNTIKTKISNNLNIQNSHSQSLNQNKETQKKLNLVAIGSNSNDFLPMGNYDNFKKINVQEILQKKREEEEKKKEEEEIIRKVREEIKKKFNQFQNQKFNQLK